jgi:peroxiredoxin Q/BCP
MRRGGLRAPGALIVVLAALAASAGAGVGTAQEPGLQPGDPAPAFTLAASDGQTYRLSDFLGIRPVVVAWFPKAFATL